MQPFVSVIIPNFNHARYLDQRIQSVLGQTYQNFEVIILDDCSTDNSLDVIEKYRTNPHVTAVIVNEKNSGNTFLQWDKGIKAAKGDWIWIAESDDYCESELLEELIIASEYRKDTVLAYSTVQAVFDNVVENEKRLFRNQYYRGKEFLRRCLSCGCVIMNASSAIFKRTAAQKVNPVYKNFKGAGDYYFWVMIAEQGNVTVVNKQLSYFRRHPDTVTFRKGKDGTNAIAEKEIVGYIDSIVNFSPLRKRYVLARHVWNVRFCQYDSDDIRKNVFDVWDVNSYIGKIDELLLKIGHFLLKNFNYYV